MDFQNFTTGTDDSNRRLDKVIRKFIPETSLSGVYKYIRKGLIKINNKKTQPEYHVQEGDVISIADFILQDIQKTEKTTSKPVELPPVIFRNQHILIIDKPYDITVQGDENSLDKLVQAEYLQNGKNNSLSFKPGPLHRLDKKTTGLLAFSQSLEGAHWFSQNIKDHTIQKKYISVLEGKITQQQEWKDYITKTEDNSSSFHTVSVSETKEDDEAKLAHTILKPITTGTFNNTDFTLCELDIKTGRMHQIRAQSSLHGHPLLGDTAYGSKNTTNQDQDFFLQAYELSFPDNPVGLPPNVKIPYSDALKSFLKRCDVGNFRV